MGLTISYTIRLSRREAVAKILNAARVQAKKHGWRVPRTTLSNSKLDLYPHAKCDPVRLDFSNSLTCEEFVKTSFAPFQTHVQIVDFLRALQPLASVLKVVDECEYWETSDKHLLKEHRERFEVAFGAKLPNAGDSPITITFGAYTIDNGKLIKGRNPKRITVPAQQRDPPRPHRRVPRRRTKE